MSTTVIRPQDLTPTRRTAARERACADPATRVTRSLDGYGIVAGPFFVVVSLAQAVTREGFDLGRHAWSQLALGALGWVQVVNFLLTGAMVIAFSVGLARTLTSGTGRRAVPLLVGAAGAGIVLAGVFRADAGAGFPVGMPEPTEPTVHGMLHLVASGLAFVALASAAFVMARRYGRERRPGRAGWSVVAAVALLAGFGTAASGSSAGVVVFTVGIVTVLTWLTTLGVDAWSRATYSHL
jgi:hypothetical membrane protein